MIIAVFGGSAPRPGDPAYEEARNLGRLIAQAGHAALTGGYMGVMEAVSQGAREAGGQAIGATCAEIEHFRPTQANPYLTEEWPYQSLSERLFALCSRCDAAIALPGGPGTLAEIGYLWNHILIRAIPEKPLVLCGPGWRKVMDTYFTEYGAYIAGHDQLLLQFTDHPAEALQAVLAWRATGI